MIGVVLLNKLSNMSNGGAKLAIVGGFTGGFEITGSIANETWHNSSLYLLAVSRPCVSTSFTNHLNCISLGSSAIS